MSLTFEAVTLMGDDACGIDDYGKVEGCDIQPADHSGGAGTGGAGTGGAGTGGAGTGGAGAGGAGTGGAATGGEGSGGVATGGAGTGGAGTGTGGDGMGEEGSGGEGSGGEGSGGEGSGGEGSGGEGSGGDGMGGASNGGCIDILSSAPAPEMQTVGLLEFTAEVSNPSSVAVHFGPTASYGMVAPAELNGEHYEATLLGMKPGSTYHYRIVVTGDESCESEDQTLETGALRPKVPLSVTTQVTGSPTPGFIILTSGMSVLIIDHDGDTVWEYALNADNFTGWTSAEMSWDGKWMYFRDLGPFNAGSGGELVRVRMDGSALETLTLPGGHHHDFAVIPDGIAYIAKSQTGACDQIYTAAPDGSGAEVLFNAEAILQYVPPAQWNNETCHVNSLNYHDGPGIYTLSDRLRNGIAVFSKDGQPVKFIGAATTGSPPFETVLAEGIGTSWNTQHGHHYYTDDQLVVFSGGPLGGEDSKVLLYTVLSNEATLGLPFPVKTSNTLGGVQHLENGRFLISPREASEIIEIDPLGQVHVSHSFPEPIGYPHHRTTLYGPPAPR